MDCTVHKLIADVAIVADDRVLLVRYRDTSRYDGQSGWFLPDDHLEHLEHPTDAARRIALGQAGLTLGEVALDHVESFGNGTWHLTFHHLAHVEEASGVHAGDNVLEARWFPLGAPPPESEMAHHGWALEVLDAMGLR